DVCSSDLEAVTSAHVEIEAGAVAQEDVTASPPGHHPPEQVARHLVGRQPPLPPESAGDAVLSLDPEYPPVHTSKLRASTTGVMGGASARRARQDHRGGRHPRVR